MFKAFRYKFENSETYRKLENIQNFESTVNEFELSKLFSVYFYTFFKNL